MLHIEEVPLDVVLPVDGIGMVMIQPYIELDLSREPYQWHYEKKNEQINRIVKALEIADKADHGCGKTHFTIFPEYAIPGLEGIEKVEEVLKGSSWKNGTVVIGGIDGLTKSDYSELYNGDITCVCHVNNPDKVDDIEWVNCSVVWVKQQDGNLRRWIQPKMVPAWPEKLSTCHNMFCGNSVHLFKCEFQNGIDCHFIILICFDWIGPIKSKEGIWAVLWALDKHWEQSARKSLDLVFLLQYNEKPNHYHFLENARNYFADGKSYPFTLRDRSVLVLVNTAGGPYPGRYKAYGYSSLIFSPDAPYDTSACPMSFAVRTNKLRGKDNLGRCKETLFREMGSCLHSFAFRHPWFC